MKFRSKVSGYVLGVRFYKEANNVGTHIGRLWTKGGTLLASVSFNNETASGWQQANFATPVAITADTTYIISYTNPAGSYSSTSRYFQSSAVTNGPLTALKNGYDGVNGVYGYSTTTVPISTLKSDNFWVDVVFNTVASTTQTAIPASISTAPTTPSTVQRAAVSTESGTASSTAEVRSLSCEPKSVQAGDFFTCQLRLDGNGEVPNISVVASSSYVRVPFAVQARAQQRLLTFHGSVDRAAPESSFSVSVGDDSNLIEDQITVLPSLTPVLSLPGTQIVKVGQPISFQVSAQDPTGLPIQISAAKLPPGATLLGDSGRLEWSPVPGQQGDYILSFSAVNSSGASSDGQVRIVVDSGKPTLAKVARTKCSPGAVATLEGRWLSLAGEEFADPTGSSLRLGGTRVKVNDGLVPVLFASPTQVDFLCPSTMPGTDLGITLETPSGTTVPVQTTMLAASPQLLRAQNLNRGQALVTVSGTDRVAMVRNHHGIGEPAQLDDLVSFRATGLGITDSFAGVIAVRVGDVDAQVESVVPALDAAGVFLIHVRIPAAAPLGDEVPVRLELISSDGRRHSSNTATLAIE
jgi:uncharacterized protein (TIGR03437 family)